MSSPKESSAPKPAQSELTMVERLDVSYGPDERHKIDFYQSSEATTSPPPLLIFIHGGAWRTGSRKDHADMARRLVSLRKGNLTVALIDYRLTTAKPLSSWSDATKPTEYENRHPAHLEDVYAALRFLLLTPKPEDSEETSSPKRKRGDGDEHEGKDKKDEEESQKQLTTPEKYGYNDEKVVLMGHSVGAWMAAAVLLDPRVARWRGGCGVPSICAMPWDQQALISKINAWILVDGIYDLISLLDEYPSYRTFVAQAFPLDETDIHGSEADQLRRASIMMWECREPEDYCCSDGPFVYMAHSEDDELLSLRQSEEAESVLIKEFAGVFDGQGRELDMPMEWDSARVALKKAHWGSHDGMLVNDDFLAYVAKIIRQDSNRAVRHKKQLW